MKKYQFIFYCKQYLTIIVAHLSLGNPKLPPERQGTEILVILYESALISL